MSEIGLKFKLPFTEIEVDVLALHKRLRWKARSDSAAKVALRFITLFEDHGIAATQIQHFIPQITLDKLTTPEAVLPALTNEVLDQAATLFGIRRAWLDGIEDHLYEFDGCYQCPTRFFEALAEIPKDGNLAPVRGLCSTTRLDYTKQAEQLVVLVLLEKIGTIGEEPIYRYHPMLDLWNWSSDKCRLQLKAMARLTSEVFHAPIPLYRAKRDVLHGIYEGTIVPGKHLPNHIATNPSLGDYAFSPEEHTRAKEYDELPWVLQYIEQHNLEAVARMALEQRGSKNA